MPECIFCRIAQGEIPATIVASDEHFVAFHDLHPQAPVHLLVIPRLHLPSIAAAGDEHREALGHLLAAVPRIARQLGLGEGYRVVINHGEQAGQTVFHLHVHLMGGRTFSWPPG